MTTTTAPRTAVRSPASLSVRALLRYAGEPILLLGTVGAGALAIANGAPLPLASLLILFGGLAYLFLMEQVIPFEAAWHPDRGEWVRDTIYFGINGAVSTVPPILLASVAVALAPGTLALPLPLAAVLAFLLYTFAGYWTHRLGHDIPALWKLHGVHHTPEKVNTWNNNVVHFGDLLFSNTVALGALLLAGFSSEAIFLAAGLSQMLSFIDHVNADFRLGWFNRLVGSPEQHRLHHSTKISEAGNYSVLPLWDIVFGTFTWRPGRVPAAIGIHKPETFPSPRSILANAIHPFRAWFSRS